MVKEKSNPRPISNAPILVFGWGKDGAGDIDVVVDEFPYDSGLRCVKAPDLDSRAVLDEISEWLKNNKNARILYLGAHGKVNGLSPDGSSLDKIGYKELAETLAANLSRGKRRLTVWLGACDSAVAADFWRMIEDLPVGLLVSFAGKPTSRVVRSVLKALIKMSDIARPDKDGTPKRLIYSDCEIAILKRWFPSISVHYKTSSLAKVDALPRQGPRSLRSILERPVRSNGVLREALANLRHGYDSENQATRDLLDQKAKDYKNVLKEGRQPIAASTVDRPKRKRKRKPSN
jgi:hypothetical protein